VNATPPLHPSPLYLGKSTSSACSTRTRFHGRQQEPVLQARAARLTCRDRRGLRRIASWCAPASGPPCERQPTARRHPSCGKPSVQPRSGCARCAAKRRARPAATGPSVMPCSEALSSTLARPRATHAADDAFCAFPGRQNRHTRHSFACAPWPCHAPAAAGSRPPAWLSKGRWRRPVAASAHRVRRDGSCGPLRERTRRLALSPPFPRAWPCAPSQWFVSPAWSLLPRQVPRGLHRAGRRERLAHTIGKRPGQTFDPVPRKVQKIPSGSGMRTAG
jgi:hypothetical protein